jgi:putative membrane protein
MTFGFVIERFGLFLKFAGREEVKVFQRQISFFIGIGFILLATGLVLYSVIQYRRTVRSLKPVEIPERYNVRVPVIANSIIGLLGLLLSIYLFRGIT